MRGPLAAAVVVACFLVLVAIGELARDVLRTKRGRTVDRSWWRRMGRFFGTYPAPAVAGWGALVRTARYDAPIGEYAVVGAVCMATVIPLVAVAGTMLKRRFPDEVAAASGSSFDYQHMSRPMKRFGIVAALVVIGVLLGALLTLETLGWAYIDLDRGSD